MPTSNQLGTIGLLPATQNQTANVIANSAIPRVLSSHQLGHTSSNTSQPIPHNQSSINLPTSAAVTGSPTTSFLPPNSSSSALSNAPSGSGGTMSGYLFKWTNYIKGYQKRWFNLSNGLLSYYRYRFLYEIIFQKTSNQFAYFRSSPTEMTHTCRGTINLANASILSEDACHFVVSNGGTQTFHLKAATELDKQKWVSAIELAKNRAKQENIDSGNYAFPYKEARGAN